MKHPNKSNLTFMRSFSLDTSREAQLKVFELLRDVPVNKKVALTFELIQTMRLMILASLRRQFPSANQAELRRRLIARLLPREDVIKAYGFDPDTGSR